MKTHAPHPVAKRIIGLLGGPTVVGAAVKRTPGAVCKWNTPKERGGTDGLVPSRYHAPLLEFAKRKGVSLGPEDFIPPLPSDEVAA